MQYHHVRGQKGVDKSVQKFFEDFAKALTDGNVPAIAGLWGVPALVSGDKMLRAVSSLDEVRDYFSGAKAQYAKHGIHQAVADIQEIKWLTHEMVLVEVRWPYIDKDGDEMGEERSTYLLRRDSDGDLKLHVAMMQGASQKH